MTTIAFRNGVIAADSRISYSTIHNGERDKLARCGEYLVALAGPTWLRHPLEAWAAEGARPDQVPEVLHDNADQFNALLVNRHGQVFQFDHGYLVPIEADYVAAGSGMLLALGAMAHGASAEQAVAAASLHDKNTGGSIRSAHISSLDS